MTLQTSVQSRVGSHGSFAVCWLQSIEALGYFTNLQRMYIRTNSVRMQQPSGMLGAFTMPALKHLTLDGGDGGDQSTSQLIIKEDSAVNLPLLHSLTLYGAISEDDLAARICRLTMLQSLSLHLTRAISDSCQLNLSPLCSLTRVDLGCTSTARLDMLLGGLTALRQLRLIASDGIPGSISCLSSLMALQELTLQGALSPDCQLDLSELMMLKRLDLCRAALPPDLQLLHGATTLKELLLPNVQQIFCKALVQAVANAPRLQLLRVTSVESDRPYLNAMLEFSVLLLELLLLLCVWVWLPIMLPDAEEWLGTWLWVVMAMFVLVGLICSLLHMQKLFRWRSPCSAWFLGQVVGLLKGRGGRADFIAISACPADIKRDYATGLLPH